MVIKVLFSMFLVIFKFCGVKVYSEYQGGHVIPDFKRFESYKIIYFLEEQ